MIPPSASPSAARTARLLEVPRRLSRRSGMVWLVLWAVGLAGLYAYHRSFTHSFAAARLLGLHHNKLILATGRKLIT